MDCVYKQSCPAKVFSAASVYLNLCVILSILPDHCLRQRNLASVYAWYWYHLYQSFSAEQRILLCNRCLTEDTRQSGHVAATTLFILLTVVDM